MVRPGIIKMTFFTPPNYLGSLTNINSEKGLAIAELFSRAGLPTEFDQNYLQSVWKKAILNSSLSGLCAVTHMTMKEAMAFNDTHDMVENLVKEGINVGTGLGISFEESFFEHCMNYLSNGGNHKPSMLYDLENRLQTEVEFLNQKIVENGRVFGIPTPYNEAVTSIIKGLDFINERTRIYIKEKAKAMGMHVRCNSCKYVLDCIDTLTYCPIDGQLIPTKAPNPQNTEER